MTWHIRMGCVNNDASLSNHLPNYDSALGGAAAPSHDAEAKDGGRYAPRGGGGSGGSGGSGERGDGPNGRDDDHDHHHHHHPHHHPPAPASHFVALRTPRDASDASPRLGGGGAAAPSYLSAPRVLFDRYTSSL